MDFLKQQLARVQQQFNQLTASQKMLSVSLMVIMLMTLMWWGRYAGQAELEPLLDQDLSAEDLSRITNDLRGRGVRFAVNGGHVLVPADQRIEIVGDLIYKQLM